MTEGSKKRKRDGEASGKPKKKVVLDAPPSTATVSSVLRPKLCPPVIATTPGINLPEKLLFHAYQRRVDPKFKSKRSEQADAQELLLHSTAHPSLNYTGSEEAPPGSKPLLNHYVGVYDPSTGKLEVIEAKKMVVRSQVRSRQAAAASAKEKGAEQSAMERITDLKQRFGTKKARKAILETALYAIAPSGDATTTNVDNATRATISTVSAVTSLMATPEEMQAAMDEAKPVPKANLEATSACDVYDPQVIIGTDVFNLVPIQGWQEKARRQEGVKTASRFVAARINRLAVDDDAVTVTRLRVLRYLELVLRFFYYSREGRTKGTRQLPPYNKLLELMEEVPEAVIESIRGKFSDAGTMSKFHMDMLMTHCCAFAFIVDNFEVYTMELRLDMRLEDKEMNRYFQALGGQVSRVRKQGLSPCVAKLELPLKFPKLKQTAPRRRGK